MSTGHSAASGVPQMIPAFIPSFNPASGMMAMQSAAIDRQQSLYDTQAQQALFDASTQAMQKAFQVGQFRENQALQYSGNGVMLAGSPLLVLNQTVALGQQEIGQALARGNNQADLIRQDAAARLLSARAQLIGDQSNWITQQAQAQMGSTANQYKLQEGFAQANAQIHNAQIGALGSLFSGLLSAGGKMFSQSGSTPVVGGAGLDPYSDPSMGGLGMVP